MDEKQEIPKEIDDHFKLFGKEPWEIEYGDKCPICNSRSVSYTHLTLPTNREV